MLENNFQYKLIKKIENELLPGSIVIKQDPGYIQGIPDLCIFYEDMYGFLEVKKNKNAIKQPNQEYYVSMLNEMSFAAFIYPENEEEVLHELQQSFESRRASRISRSKQI